MKYSVLSIALATTASAISITERNANAPTLRFDIQRRQPSISISERDRLRKRQSNTLQITLDNLQTLYFANVTIGTPGQSLRLDIDTGSSDIWANSATSTLCRSSGQQCSQSGVYNANQSSTYQYQNSLFSIKYADGSYAQGDYATDTLSVGGQDIPNVPFGIGYRSTSAQGILGVGYAANEASVGNNGLTYQNFPLVLTKAGIIATPAYSLWLNDLQASTGSILFGGIDKAKFTGTLGTVPVLQENNGDGTYQYREFIIALTSLSIAGQQIVSTSIPVLLDSGSSLSYLPTQYAQAVFSMFNAQYSDQNGVATVSCNYKNSDKTMVFSFSGLNITVPMSEMVIVDGVRKGQQVCILGISDAAGSTSVLGDTFLRSAYVVYDLANNKISLAPTKFNATDSSITAIASGAAGVPSATSVVNAVSSVAAVTSGGARAPSVTAISPASTILPNLKAMVAGLAMVGLLAASL